MSGFFTFIDGKKRVFNDDEVERVRENMANLNAGNRERNYNHNFSNYDKNSFDYAGQRSGSYREYDDRRGEAYAEERSTFGKTGFSEQSNSRDTKWSSNHSPPFVNSSFSWQRQERNDFGEAPIIDIGEPQQPHRPENFSFAQQQQKLQQQRYLDRESRERERDFEAVRASRKDRDIPSVLHRSVPRESASRAAAAASSNAGADGTKKTRREKYMPPKKTETELFEKGTMVECGDKFDTYFGIENDETVNVTGPNINADYNMSRIQSFGECEFSPEIMKNITLMRFKTPTQIQKFVIPLIQRKSKGDILGQAMTGSGKTAAFLLPIIDKIQQFKSTNQTDKHAPLALILAPTRELCQQLYDDARRFATGTGVTVHLNIGDMPVPQSLSALREGCDICTWTIGRANHFIIKDQYVSLKDVLFLVMDEADKMISSDNEFTVRAIKEESGINPRHRTLLFSATFDELAQEKLKRYVHETKTYFVHVGDKNQVVSSVAQRFIQVRKFDKQESLIELLKTGSKKQYLNSESNEFTYIPQKTIVFVGYKRQSDRIAMALAVVGFNVISINSDRTLRQRSDAVDKFSKGIYHVLVATDVASRGMNLPYVEHVINFDLPSMEDISYIHRVGRAGRIGNTGTATSFFDPDVDKDFAEFYLKLLRSTNQDVPEFLTEIVESRRKDQFMMKHIHGIGPNERNDKSWT